MADGTICYTISNFELPRKVITTPPKAKFNPSHIIDRKIIKLVKERKLLYARNTMSVGNYHARAAQMWQEIAREMQWSVADVKRKWSHIRNSYSRHLRNEMNGARTIKGRKVTKWYLADDLNFLREHMATDLRQFNSSFPSTSSQETYEIREISDQDQVESVTLLPSSGNITWPFSATEFLDSSKTTINSDEASVDFSKVIADENSSYFTFFRGIHEEYLQLSSHGRRVFKQKCLLVLHGLLDEEDQLRNCSGEVVIEEPATEVEQQTMLIKNESNDQETREATDALLSDMVETTVEVVDGQEYDQ